MVNMHGAKLETPAESLVVVERLLKEIEHDKQMDRLRLHLEARREMLIRKMQSEGSGCTGLKNSEENTSARTGEPA